MLSLLNLLSYMDGILGSREWKSGEGRATCGKRAAASNRPGFLAQAQASGMTVEEYALAMVEGAC